MRFQPRGGDLGEISGQPAKLRGEVLRLLGVCRLRLGGDGVGDAGARGVGGGLKKKKKQSRRAGRQD